MAIKLTAKEFFEEKLDRSIKELSDIDRTFAEKGEAAAEKQFADYIRGAGLDRERFFKEVPTVELTDKILKSGERIIDGWVESCGVPLQFPERKNIDWFANPTYNAYREWTWQLSRHPEWSRLASLFRATGDEKYAEAFEDYLVSWCEQTEEPPHGTSAYSTLAWRTLECGIRLEGSWTESIMAFSQSKTLSDHAITCFFRSVWEQVDRIFDASTGYNWLVSEMTGGCTAAVSFRFFKDSAQWHERSIARLSEQLDVQIYPDGFQFELTTGYHSVVLTTYLRVISIQERMGITVNEDFKAKVMNLYRVFVKLMLPDRTTPDLNDGSRIDVPARCREAIRRMPSMYSEFGYLADGKGPKPEFDSIAMEYSGYAVMRSGWDEDDFCTILEAAPFGAAHQHEDKLEVILHAYGKRMLDDPGRFRYDTSEMRQYTLSSYSHNVALVDGLGQHRRGIKSWIDHPLTQKADLRVKFGGDIEVSEGFYSDGFGDSNIPVRHERTLIWHKNGIGDVKLPFYTVYDRFIPEDGCEHTYTLLWHLPECDEIASGNAVTAPLGDGVEFTVLGMTEPRVVKGQTEPVFMGWRPNHTPGDNPHFPTPTVNYDYKGGILSAVTLLVPTKDTENPFTAVNCDDSGNITVTAKSGEYTFNKNDLF